MYFTQWVLRAAPIFVSLGVATAAGPLIRQPTSSAQCCSVLAASLGPKISFPGSATYTAQQNGSSGYWSSQEQELGPTCRASPTTANDVSVAVALLAKNNCLFAIRGGGHMSWAGAANIADGVTIDLGALNSVAVSTDLSTTSVGAGARWIDVYAALDPRNLSVSGGRVYDVGVGGLLTGGGNSFFAPRYGFGCDNVVSFEVVLGSGELVNANASSHADLFRALKGGTNNFGVVTRFDLKTFSQGQLWGGFVYNDIGSAAEQFQYLQDFTTASGNGEDPYASIINAYIFTALGPTIIANQMTYTKPEANPTILQNFTSIQPQLMNTMRITNLTDITIETGAGTPNNTRQLFGTATFANNATILAEIYSIAQAAFAPLQTVLGFQGSFVLQPMPRSITNKGILNGGNVLGFGPELTDFVWLDITVQWTLSTDDVAVNSATQTLLTNAIAYAKTQGQYNEFLYLNYAMQSQDPIAGYGAANQAFLQEVSKAYDPGQVFQTLVPGGFKLHRTNVTCC